MRTAFPVFNGFAPAEGPKALTLDLDFSTLAEQKIDFQLEETTGQFQFVQGVYVDNSRNTNPLTILVAVTNQRLVIPAGAQLTAPIFSIDQTQVTISTVPSNGLICQVIFLNVPTAYNSWGPITVNVPGLSVNTQPYQGQRSAGAAPTTISNAGNTALLAANAARRGVIIQASPMNDAPIIVNLPDPIWLLPGERFASDAWVPMGAITATGLTASNQSATAIEFI